MDETYIDLVTGEEISVVDGLFLIDLDQMFYDLIKQDYPHITGDEFISYQSLTHYRLKKINDLVHEDEKSNKKIRDRVTKIFNDENYQEIDVHKELDDSMTFGQHVADVVTKFGGSWTFIIGFIAFLAIWMIINTLLIFGMDFDPYPFILLNLALSMISALQAPLIMMSQNRAAAYDRMESKNDYRVNKKSEVELRLLHSKIDHLIQQDQPNILEIQKLQTEMLSEISQQIVELKKET